MLPFFFITAILLLYCFTRLRLRNGQRYRLGYYIALFLGKVYQLGAELLHCDFIAYFVEGAGKLVLHHEVDVIVGITRCLQGNDALADGIYPLAAIRKFELLILLFGEVLIIRAISE